MPFCKKCGAKKFSWSLNQNGLCESCCLKAQKRLDFITPNITHPNVCRPINKAPENYIPPSAPDGAHVSVFIDVETTGLSPYKDSIVQVSAIRFFDDKCIDGINTYINPTKPIPAAVTKIHGITDSMVKDAPKISEIKDQFFTLIKGAVLVGYNIKFDLNFLNSAFDGALNGIKYVDVLQSARKILFLPNYRLETVASHLGFYPEGGYHNSMADCTATAAVFFRLDLQSLLDCAYTYSPQSPPKSRYSSVSVTPRIFTADELPTAAKNPLFMKNIVFTGTLKIPRYEAAQMATDVGAMIKSAVSGKTDYLVVGQRDISLVGADGMSTKEEKAYALNSAGKANIKIICESEFLALINTRG